MKLVFTVVYATYIYNRRSCELVCVSIGPACAALHRYAAIHEDEESYKSLLLEQKSVCVNWVQFN